MATANSCHNKAVFPASPNKFCGMFLFLRNVWVTSLWELYFSNSGTILGCPLWREIFTTYDGITHSVCLLDCYTCPSICTISTVNDSVRVRQSFQCPLTMRCAGSCMQRESERTQNTMQTFKWVPGCPAMRKAHSSRGQSGCTSSRVFPSRGHGVQVWEERECL